MNALHSEKEINRSEIPDLMDVTKIDISDHGDSFLVLVPKGWSQKSVEGGVLNPFAPLPVAVWEKGDSAFQVQALLLENEISVGHLLRQFLQSMNAELGDYQAVSPKMAHCDAGISLDGSAFTLRVSAYILGNIAFFLQVVASRQTAGSVMPLLDVATRSFDPARQPTPNQIEDWQSSALTTPKRAEPSISLRHPASWRAHTSKTENRAVLDLTREVDSISFGVIRVKLVDKSSGESLDDREFAAKVELQETGLEPTELLRQESALVDELFKNGVLRIYAARADDANVEAWILNAETQQEFVTFSMVTPAQEADFKQWAINHRAFKIVSETAISGTS